MASTDADADIYAPATDVEALDGDEPVPPDHPPPKELYSPTPSTDVDSDISIEEEEEFVNEGYAVGDHYISGDTWIVTELGRKNGEAITIKCNLQQIELVNVFDGSDFHTKHNIYWENEETERLYDIELNPVGRWGDDFQEFIPHKFD